MTTEAFPEPEPTLEHKTLHRGEARVAVLIRTYAAPVDDVWDACTNPDRLARWYVPVTGDLRLGGTVHQAGMGSGTVSRCEPPGLLVLSFDGVDEIELRLSPLDDDSTRLELRHATTLASHEIGGQTYDAIFCMGGGYYPRLLALDLHLRGTLPDDYNALEFHLRPQMRPVIDRGSAAMAALLADAAGAGPTPG